jgi:hypothetical protein
MNQKFMVEIIKNGHEMQQLELNQIEDLRAHGYLISVQIGTTLKALQSITTETLQSANRIVAHRIVMGG